MASATATTAAGEGAAPGKARAEQSRSSAQRAAEGSPAASLPPGPRAHPIVQTLAWAFAPTWLMDTCAKRVGDSFTITFWPSRFQLALVSDPDAVKATFTAPPEIAPSGAGNSPIASVMGPHSVITLTGTEHMRQRKLLLPPFHGERMRDYEDVIVQETRRDMASWPIGRPMRLHERTRKVTLEVMLLAGHETTATSVAWAIERLVRHPDKLRRLQGEIDARPRGEANGLGQGTGEEYLTAVVRETLRVRPVVPIVVRVLQEDYEIGGRVLPAGTRVTPSIYLAHRHGRVQADAEAVPPQRHLAGAAA